MSVTLRRSRDYTADPLVVWWYLVSLKKTMTPVQMYAYSGNLYVYGEVTAHKIDRRRLKQMLRENKLVTRWQRFLIFLRLL